MSQCGAFCPDHGARCVQEEGHDTDEQHRELEMHEHFWPDEDEPTGELCSWPRPVCVFCLKVIRPDPVPMEGGTMYPGWMTRDSPVGRLAYHIECAGRYRAGEPP
jgi:hypothetical protein